MANKAFVIDSRGLKVFIHKNQLTKADLGKSFFCCGYSKEKGDYCEAPLGVSSSGHFYQAKHSHPHAPDCPYSKRNSESRVSVLDTRAKDLKIAELLYRIGLEKDAPSVSPAGPRTPKPPAKKNEEEDLSKLVVQRRQHPKNVSQLVDLLSSLMLDDLYANTTVGKIILDQRNEADYRENGIPENSPMRLSQNLCKPPMWCIIGAPHWR